LNFGGKQLSPITKGTILITTFVVKKYFLIVLDNLVICSYTACSFSPKITFEMAFSFEIRADLLDV
jgi:hypothetical protein